MTIRTQFTQANAERLLTTLARVRHDNDSARTER